MSNHENRSNERVTLQDFYGNYQRVTLPAPFYEASASGPEDWTGVWITALYYGPRSGRMFSRTYSIWDDGHGRNVGTRYREIDRSDFLHYCDLVGVEPPAGLQAEDVA